MVDVKRTAYETLNDERLTDIVEDVFDAYPSTVEVFPCVVFLDVGQTDTEYADNKNLATSYEVEVHIFTKALDGYPTTFEIGNVVETLMKENDFYLTLNTEVPDTEDEVRHRVMGFRNLSF